MYVFIGCRGKGSSDEITPRMVLEEPFGTDILYPHPSDTGHTELLSGRF